MVRDDRRLFSAFGFPLSAFRFSSPSPYLTTAAVGFIVVAAGSEVRALVFKGGRDEDSIC